MKIAPISFILFVITCVSASSAQNKLSETAQAAATAADLNDLKQALSDPDPIKREAAMIAVVQSGNGHRIDFALRTAFASDDPGMRAVALRAYLARTQQLEFELQAPPGVQRLIDNAQNSGDPDDMRHLTDRFPYVGLMAGVGFRIRLKLEGYEMTRNAAVASTPGMTKNVQLGIAGSRVTGIGSPIYGNNCSLSFEPKQTVKGAAPVLMGTLSCTNYAGNMIIVSPLF